jgi:Ufm1-specific protease 2
LDARLGVQCKYIIANTGPELQTKGREIARHFDEQGTPIMMGGGKLAFTILGIAYDTHSGE